MPIIINRSADPPREGGRAETWVCAVPSLGGGVVVPVFFFFHQKQRQKRHPKQNCDHAIPLGVRTRTRTSGVFLELQVADNGY